MASTFKTPGVYVREISKFPPSVAAVDTAVPAFIGYTATAVDRLGRNLVGIPTKVDSLLEFNAIFGEAPVETEVVVTFTEEEQPDGTFVAVSAIAALDETARNPFVLPYAVEFYFENGGGPCYILAVDTLDNPAGPPAAPNFDQLNDSLPILEAVDEVTLISFPDAVYLSSAFDYYSLQNNSLAQCNKLQDRFAVMDVITERDPAQLGLITIDGNLIDADQGMRNSISSTVDFTKYGAAYWPPCATNIRFNLADDSITTAGLNSGIGDMNALEAADTIAYNLGKQALNELSNNLYPSAGVLGVYARVDSTRGVWKAPANESLLRVLKPLINIDNDAQANLNVHTTGKSINAVRAFTGRGILVWGSRTLAGNDNEWRYVPVRRFFNFVEESVKKATEPFVFEPNDRNTWVKVRGLIENFLLLQWRAGALAGATPEEAFFVRVGLPETMSALDILEGRMIVEIGMAVVRPAEFIILKFSHKLQTS